MEDVMGQEKKYRWWEWIIYIIILPLLFTSILVGTLMTVMGYDVMNSLLSSLNKVPVIEKVIPDPHTELDPEAERYANNLEALKSEILRLEAEQSKGVQQLATYEKELERKDVEIAKLKSTLARNEQELAAQEKAAADQAQNLKELGEIFRSMSASKAAKIFDQLSTVEAALVMEGLAPEEKGQILAKMDPEKAATLTLLLKDGTLDESAQATAYQEEIQRLKTELEKK